jgi:hypothetical protein
MCGATCADQGSAEVNRKHYGDRAAHGPIRQQISGYDYDDAIDREPAMSRGQR